MVYDVVEKMLRASLTFGNSYRCMQRPRKCSKNCVSPFRAKRVLWTYVDEFDQKDQRRRIWAHVAGSQILHYLDTFISSW